MTSHPIRRRRRIWRTLPRRVLNRPRRPQWGPDRLDPAGRLRPPGRSTTLRAALVVALLLAAAAFGYRDLRAVDPETAGPPPGPVSPTDGPTAAPTSAPTAAPTAAPAGEDGIGPDADPATGWPERWPGDGDAWPPDGGTGDNGAGDNGASPGEPGTGHTGGGEPARLPVPEGMVGVAVPLAEPAMLAVLRPGDRVDLLSVPEGGGEPWLVADDAGVLAVDPANPALLLSLTDDQARVVLSARPGTLLAVTVRP